MDEKQLGVLASPVVAGLDCDGVAHLLSGSGAVSHQYCKLITIFLNEDTIGYEPLGFLLL